VGNQTTYGRAISTAATYSDYLVATVCGIDSAGGIYTSGTRWLSSSGTTPFDTITTLWASTATNIAVAPTEPFRLTGVSFDITTQTLNAQVGTILVMGHPCSQNVVGNNSTGMAAPYVAGAEMVALAYAGGGGPGPLGLFAHTNRMFGIWRNNNFITGLNPLSIEFDNFLIYSDPPGSNAATANINFTGNLSYSLENASGFGAWGSVSTGELILIRKGQGGVVVSGDGAFPTSVTKLPAIQGTGGILQRMTMCDVGAVYVTESAGVWAWNGGNTSQKISPQIPDNATIRPELQPGGATPLGAIGARAHHDVFGGLVFFANNWVFDSINNSWWLCEDPNVLNFATWTVSKSTTRFIYGMPGVISTGGNHSVYVVDNETVATSWAWTSNPIPSPPVGGIPTLSEVEIFASNPTAQPATITVTPTVPAGMASSFINPTQSIPFTIPAHTSGFRQSKRCGFQEYNLCVAITASGSAGAPTLHEVNLGYTRSRTTGIA